MLIRAMDIDDLDRIIELEHQLFPMSSWQKSDFLYEMFENQFSHNYVLENEGQIVGYVGFWIMYEQSQITTIGIDENNQNQGLGFYLMNEVMNEVMEHGCEVMSLEVRVSNHKAIRLYEKFGFETRAIRKDYYQDNHEDAYLMVKSWEVQK